MSSAADTRTVAVLVKAASTSGTSRRGSGWPHRSKRNATVSAINRTEATTNTVIDLRSALIFSIGHEVEELNHRSCVRENTADISARTQRDSPRWPVLERDLAAMSARHLSAAPVSRVLTNAATKIGRARHIREFIAKRIWGEYAAHCSLATPSTAFLMNGANRSIGIGRKVVVLCSLEISRIVWRKRNCRAMG